MRTPLVRPRDCATAPSLLSACARQLAGHVLLPPPSVSLSEGLDCFFEGLFVPFESLQLIGQALGRHLAVTVLLQQGVALTAGCLKGCIGLFQALLERLPALGIGIRFSLALLLIELLEIALQGAECCFDLLETMAVAPARLAHPGAFLMLVRHCWASVDP